uniref:EF-hand domain-containing protein n=1 Tax=Proboscia inermis TaxID=420281 RepID=A0A7S0C312_9STRA
MPDLSPSDVAEFLEAGDTNRDGLLDYKEYLSMLGSEDEEEKDEAKVSESGKTITKVGVYGVSEMRKVISERRRAHQEKMHLEQIRREVQQAELESKIFEEELIASVSRKGGANPKRLVPETKDKNKTNGNDDNGYYGVEFDFVCCKPPVRTVVTGKNFEFRGVLHARMLRMAQSKPLPIPCEVCKRVLQKMGYASYWDKCNSCNKSEYETDARHRAEYTCGECYGYFMCKTCYKAKKENIFEEIEREAQKDTYVHCQVGTSLSLLIPSNSIIGSAELKDKLSNAIKDAVDLDLVNNKDRVSDILADRYLLERVSESSSISSLPTDVSIFSTSQTKCRSILDNKYILDECVRAGVSTLLEGEKSENIEHSFFF